ncbi:MAG TPA: 8-oxo-dGTP diphosphatase [Verrucomicrobiae bacterium]|nr:8-oxo-dGTP diphosphatase [Verrucomicrobiae bacterium]
MILATLCYVKKNGKTLMMQRGKRPGDMHAGKWNGLGGKMNPGETPEECCVREVREESGLEVRRPKLHGIITFPKFNEKHDWYAFVFTADEFDGEPFAECDEGRLEWIGDAKVPELPLWEGDRVFLKWLDQEKFFSAKFIYQHGQYIRHEVVFY